MIQHATVATGKIGNRPFLRQCTKMILAPLTAQDVAALQQAFDIHRRGQPESALRILGGLPAGHPDVLHLRGLVRKTMGDTQGAEEDMRTAAAGANQPAQILTNLGNLLAETGRWPDARMAYQAAITSAPGDGNAWMNYGISAQKAEAYDDALAALLQATRLLPNSGRAWNALGTTLRSLRREEEALSAFDRSIALDPKARRAWVNRGVCQMTLGFPDEAAISLAQARSLGESSPELADAEAGLALRVGRIEQAIDSYKQLCARNPEYVPGHRALSQIAVEYGLALDPADSWRTAVEAQPENLSLHMGLLRVLVRAKRHAEAMDWVTAGQRRFGTRPEFETVRAMVAAEQDDRQACTDAFQSALAMAPDDPEVASLFARALLTWRQPDRAAAVLEHAITATPYHQSSWAYLGSAWRLLEDPREHWLHDYEHMVMPITLEPLEPGVTLEASMASLSAVLRPLHTASHHPPEQTLRGGTQTVGALLVRREPELQRLRRMIDAAIAKAAAHLRARQLSAHPLYDRLADTWRYYGSWSVRLTSGGFHISHIHPEGWLSSALYVALPDAVQADGQQGWIQFGTPPDELGLDLPPRRVVQPQVGMLALFPSYTWHGTLPFAEDAERLTVAFDIAPA